MSELAEATGVSAGDLRPDLIAFERVGIVAAAETDSERRGRRIEHDVGVDRVTNATEAFAAVLLPPEVSRFDHC